MPVYTTPRLKSDYDEAELLARTEPSIIIDGLELTAKNIWEYDGDREELAKKVFDYFRSTGFQNPYPMTDDEIKNEFKKIQKFQSNDILNENNEIKNSANVGLNICKQFNFDIFYKVHDDSSIGIEDAFNDDELLMKVIKNRMGWNTEFINGKEIPYMFDISYKGLITGFRSSRVGFSTSNFRPVVAKFLFEKYGGKSTLDLSGGWGARYLGAKSLNMHYYGIDPLTAPNIQKMIDFFDDSLNSSVVQGGSEDENSYLSFPEVDSIIVCPPYFTLEKYSEDTTQSTVKYSNYDLWLKDYWGKSVVNSVKKLKTNGHFIFIMLDIYKKYNLLEDMSKPILDNGLVLVDSYNYKTSRSHLSGKKTSKINTKNTEKVLIFKYDVKS
jgi:hypothetical protein